LSSSPTGLFTLSSCSIDASGQLLGAFTISSSARGGADPSTHTGGVSYTVTAKSSVHTHDTASKSPFYVEPLISLNPVSGSPQVGSGSPPGGAAATTVTVTGTGFNPADTGCTFAEGSASPDLKITSQTCSVSSSTGKLTGSFKVGIGSISGHYTVTAKGNIASDVQANTADFYVIGNIALSPISGSKGSIIGVFGAGFSNTADTCQTPPTLPYISGTPVGTSGECTKNADGTLAGQFEVQDKPSGTYLVSYFDKPGPDSAYATFKVAGVPVISLSLDTGHTGDIVTVSGSGFSSADLFVSITSDPTGLFSPSPKTCTVSGGIISAGCTFTVNSLAPGLVPGSVYEVTATGDAAHDPSSAYFFLTATLILTPNGGAAGTSVAMSGSGYIAGPTDCVTETSSTPTGLFSSGPHVPAGQCNIDGNGILTGSFTVDGSAPFGSYTVAISDLAGTEVPQTTVTARFDVALPMITLSPDSGGGGDTITISGNYFSSADTTCALSSTDGTNLFTAVTCSISGGVVHGSFKVPGANTPAQSGKHITLTGNSMDSAEASFSVVPKITFTPNPAHLGSTVTVTGTNFMSASSTCSIAGDSVLGSPVSTCNVGADFALFGSSFTVDPTFSGASDTVTVTDSDTVTSASATLDIAVPQVALNPTSGTVGASISVTGTSFSAADSCPASLISGTPVDSSPVGCSSVSAGTISGSFIVKAGTPPGIYTVTLTGNDGDVGDASFTVVPGITLNPSSGGAGTSVLVSGSNFAPGDTGCTIQSIPTGLITNAVCTVAGGSMSGSFKVASGASGPYSVTVTGTSGDVGTASFSSPGGRSMTLTPDSGPIGTVVAASGSNFAGTSCSLSSIPGGLFTSSSCALSAGTLTGGFTVGSGATVGSYTLTATSNLGSTDSASASFSVTVGAGATFSMSPTSGLGGTVVLVSGENYAGTTCTLSSVPSGLFSSTPTCSISGGALTGSFTVATGASAGGYTVKVTTNTPSDTNIAQFTIPTPTFTLTPTSSPVGTTIAASGVNYAGATCTLSSSPSGLFTSQTCSISSGTLTGGFTVASTAPLGGYTVTVTTNVAGETKTTTFAVESPGPQTFALSPSSGPAGISVSASGQNYDGTTCTLSSTPSGLFASSSCSISAGTLSGSFTVAAGASDGYTVTVTTNLSEAKSASFTTTTSPPPTLNPTTGSPGTSVQVFGSGYHGTTCSLTSSPPGLFSSSLCSLSGGTLTGSFTIASDASGSYIVTLTTDLGETAQSPFAVRLPVSFTLTPISGSSGTAVSASGNNYQGTSCTLSSSPQGLMSTSACALSGGRLTGGFTVASGAPVGSYTVTVTSDVSSDTTSAVFSVTKPTTTAPVCIIATTTFGSEAAPAVQFLRNFRDGLVLHTSAGSAFMAVFNAWYYSFSPTVAGFISAHDPIRTPIKVILYPLLGILELSQFTYSALGAAPEFAIVVAGLIASSLIGLVYLTPFMIVSMRSITRRKRINTASMAKASLVVLAASLGLLAAGELAGSFLILAVASSAIVLTCIIAVPTIVALVALHPRTQ
jgi:hypothetical protein